MLWICKIFEAIWHPIWYETASQRRIWSDSQRLLILNLFLLERLENLVCYNYHHTCMCFVLVIGPKTFSSIPYILGFLQAYVLVTCNMFDHSKLSGQHSFIEWYNVSSISWQIILTPRIRDSYCSVTKKTGSHTIQRLTHYPMGLQPRILVYKILGKTFYFFTD